MGCSTIHRRAPPRQRSFSVQTSARTAARALGRNPLSCSRLPVPTHPLRVTTHPQRANDRVCKLQARSLSSMSPPSC
eukprot:1854741-Prymnesium_polylepis.1